MTWNIFAIAASVLLLFFLCWKEIRRPNKSRLVWRLLASFVAVFSLVFLAVPPSFKGKKSIVSSNEILLLTDGFNKDSLDKYRNLVPRKPKIFTADEALFRSIKTADVHFIPDFDQWKKEIPANTAVRILGFGLNEDELQNLRPLTVRFNAPELPSGITVANWTSRLNAGETFKVQGNFISQSEGKIKLLFKTLGTNLDSTEIAAKNSIGFSFSAIPKQSGRAVFRLVALSGKDTLENDALPLIIDPAKTLKVLMLSASPDFENHFLMNWLGENEYAVAARSKVSKNKTATAFINLNKLSLEKITPALLQNFDVLISDATEFGNLSQPETAAVLAQMSRNGLGLILRADSSNASFIHKNFSLEPSQDPKKDLNLKLNDASGTRLNIQTDHPSFIKNQPGTQVLVQDNSGRLMATSKLYGSGKLILSTLNNTFSWQLAGKKKDYAAFWSVLLSKAARKTDSKENLTSPFYMDKNSMSILKLASATTGKATLQVDNEAVALEQVPAIPFLWKGRFWPRQSGWLPALINGRPSEYIYVDENPSWKTYSAAKNIRKTLAFVQNSNGNQKKDQNQQQNELILISPFWFYLFFLLSCAFLWFETKLL